MDYPQFFSYIAAIIGNFLFKLMKYSNIININNIFFLAPLLLSQSASFDFNNLKDACTSIRSENSSTFFIEVLNKILSSKETQDIKEVSSIC